MDDCLMPHYNIADKIAFEAFSFVAVRETTLGQNRTHDSGFQSEAR